MSHYGIFGRLQADSFVLTGTIKRKIYEHTGTPSLTYAITASDDIIVCTGTNLVVTLPLIATIGNGAQYTIINNNTDSTATNNIVTINRSGTTDTIDDGTSTSRRLWIYSSITLVAYPDGAANDRWEVL